MGEVLSVRNLSVAFRGDGGWAEVVRKVSFDVPQGRTLAVVGESGSGKSVTALACMGLLPPGNARATGEVLFGGRNLLALPPEEMRQVRGNGLAMIFQEPMTSLNPVMTLGQQVIEALTAHRRMTRTEARAEALRLLDRVRIPAATRRFDDYPHQFSGGMRQRVMIAMALAARPRLLIADEPTTALDVTVQAQILDLIRDLQASEGMSVLFITHDMGVVAEIADEMVVMLQGEMVEAGPVADLFRAASHPYTRALLSAVPRLGSLAGTSQPRKLEIVDPQTGARQETRPQPPTVRVDAPPVLEVRNLTTRFDVETGILGRVTARIHAVENVSFDLRRGETLALVGESGCGKSTLGRSVLRLIPPTSGSVRVAGTEISSLPSARLSGLRQAAQMIFQDPYASLNPRLTVGASIVEPLVIHGRGSAAGRRETLARLLTDVGLDPSMARRYPHEFSGGQRQRICIARSLALSPELIVADEAVSALDVSVKAQIVNLMLDFQERLGLSYLFISHDMSVVERVSHRIAVMYLGRIVEIGSREAVLSSPVHPYTRRLIEAVPVPDPAARTLHQPAPAVDLPSPMRPLDWVAPKVAWRKVGPDHLVLDEAGGR